MQVKGDLRHKFGDARDQGPRPTCLAFAVSDAHASLRNVAWEPLSCEYAYYHAVQISHKDPSRGVSFDSILPVIRVNGQPHEQRWPYLKQLPPDRSMWKPPNNVQPLFRRDSVKRGSSLGEIIDCIDRAIPIVIDMTISDAFYRPGPDGIIDSRDALDRSRRHAVVALGHGARGKDRFVLVRNSWGDKWGLKGHAWLAEQYLLPRLVAYAELTREL